MAWFPDWELRKAWVVRNGLPIVIDEARVTPDGFVALYLQAEEACLPHSNVSRGFPLHVSLGFRSDYPEGFADALVDAINAQMANQLYVFNLEWVGHGGAAMIRGTDPFALDPVINLLHANGHYGRRQLHISL